MMAIMTEAEMQYHEMTQDVEGYGRNFLQSPQTNHEKAIIALSCRHHDTALSAFMKPGQSCLSLYAQVTYKFQRDSQISWQAVSDRPSSHTGCSQLGR